LPNGSYRVDIDPAGYPINYGSRFDAVRVEAVSGGVTTLSVPLIPVYGVTGIVKNTNGETVIGARVEATNLKTNVKVISITNDNGFYSLDGLEQGDYKFTVSGFPATPDQLRITPNTPAAQNIDLTVQISDNPSPAAPTVPVSPTVPAAPTVPATSTDKNGNLLADTRIEIIAADGKFKADFITNNAGAFYPEGLGKGEYPFKGNTFPVSQDNLKIDVNTQTLQEINPTIQIPAPQPKEKSPKTLAPDPIKYSDIHSGQQIQTLLNAGYVFAK
jgi:Carboxypeptidase regulatory-like domain